MLKHCYACLVAGLLFAASCSSPKKVVYFNETIPLDSTVSITAILKIPDIIIRPDDIVAINVTSISSSTPDRSPVAIFNEGGSQSALQSSSAQSSTGGAPSLPNGSYLVDPEGFIDYPVIGKTHIAGLTIRQLKDLLHGAIIKYIQDPVVDARIVNYRVTLLGEVGRVGPIYAQNQRMTILDAISQAGDIPVSGRKDNVMIIRENNGQREVGHIDLNSSQAFNSPFYYLNQNDIVYVEPTRIRKQENNTFLRFYLPTITTLLSAGLAVYGVIVLTQNQK